MKSNESTSKISFKNLSLPQQIKIDLNLNSLLRLLLVEAVDKPLFHSHMRGEHA
jgi:hypothetical protein